MAAKKQTANGNNGSKWIRPAKRLAINLRDHFQCLYCLKDLTSADPRDVTLDHIDGIHAPGHHHEGNLCTACRSCNSWKQDMPVERFASPEALKHIRRNVKRSLNPYLKLAKAYFNDEVGREDLIEKASH